MTSHVVWGSVTTWLCIFVNTVPLRANTQTSHTPAALKRNSMICPLLFSFFLSLKGKRRFSRFWPWWKDKREIIIFKNLLHHESLGAISSPLIPKLALTRTVVSRMNCFCKRSIKHRSVNLHLERSKGNCWSLTFRLRRGEGRGGRGRGWARRDESGTHYYIEVCPT